MLAQIDPRPVHLSVGHIRSQILTNWLQAAQPWLVDHGHGVMTITDNTFVI